MRQTRLHLTDSAHISYRTLEHPENSPFSSSHPIGGNAANKDQKTEPPIFGASAKEIIYHYRLIKALLYNEAVFL
jgi:hypothetical protein